MKSKKIRAVTGFSKQTHAQIVSRATAVYNKLNGHPWFSKLPVDLAVLKAGTKKLSALIAEALDGSKKVIAERDKEREAVIEMLRLLVHYVEITSKGDMALFESSGFDPLPAAKGSAPSLSDKIRKIEHGANSGQTLLWLKANREAFSYELRWAAVGAGGLAGEWTNKPVTIVKTPTTIDGLTPGATYLFQARVLTKQGFTDWSDSATFICT